jgi:DNA-binding transcriptional regulator YdaS (Cro superfamily)
LQRALKDFARYAFNLAMTDEILEITKEAKRRAGGPSKLALAIGGLTSQAVSGWKKIPMGRVFEVSRVTGIPAHKLRPDVFPAIKKSSAKKAKA